MNTTTKATFWDGTHTLSPLLNKLQKQLPVSGAVAGEDNVSLDKLRRIINVYFELLNNGGCNLTSSKTKAGEREDTIRELLPVSVSALKKMARSFQFDAIEDIVAPVLATVILEAAKEQSIEV